MKILLIEDEKRLARLIKDVLEEEKYTLDVENDGEIGYEVGLRNAHDLIIIDWMLPGRDGPSICRGLRAAGNATPILMLTARSQVEDRVAGLESGADDYLVKPFDFNELIARIHALSRRYTAGRADSAELRVGTVVMDLNTHTLRRGDTPIELTKREWDMCEFFLRHPDQTLSRSEILDYAWSYDAQVRPDLVDVYVSYLRQKLTISGKKDPIQTVRGFGYKLESKNA